jgi:outer membrane translocation and assembly module TamA
MLAIGFGAGVQFPEKIMRIAIGFLFLSSFGFAAQVPTGPTGPFNIPIQVRTLTIDSNDVSPLLRQNIVLAYQGRTCSLEELKERIRRGLGDLGYANADVEIPQYATMAANAPKQPTDVTVRVSLGAIYRIGEIRFERQSVFSIDVLRSQFPLADGDVFKATAIEDGLNKLRSLYASEGYINFGAIPKVQYDDTRYTLSVTVQLDEGFRYHFGQLHFSGREPNQDAFQKMLDAWKSIEDKPYDYRLLENFLAANAVYFPAAANAAETAADRYVTAHQNEKNHRVEIEIRFPQP